MVWKDKYGRPDILPSPEILPGAPKGKAHFRVVSEAPVVNPEDAGSGRKK